MRPLASFGAMLMVVALLCGCAAEGTLAQVGSSVGAARTARAVAPSSIGTTSIVQVPSSEGASTASTASAGAPTRQPEPAGSSSSAAPRQGPVRGTPPASQPPAVPTLPRSRPVRIQVPAIGVDSGLLDLGLQDDGTMEVPPDAASLGWFTGAPTPGQLGPAVIVGHVDWAGELGSFYDLGELKPGDDITVTREDGSSVIFKVSRRGQYAKDDFPTDAVYANTDHAALRLITCGGEFDRETGNYLDNIIVFADMVQSRK